MAEAKLVAAVLKQVEFYFSDSNLPRDKFLLGEVKKSEEGWVAIEKIASFKRMKSLTEDTAKVVEALRQSPELLEVSEDGANVRRKSAIPEAYDDKANSVYAKGFPADATVDSVTEFFAKVVAEGQSIKAVRLRRTRGKVFKGSVFVEFSSKAEADRVGALELKLEGAEEKLLVMTKQAYWDMKAKEKFGDKATGKKRKAAGEVEEEKEEPLVYTNDLLVKVVGTTDSTSWEEIKKYLVDAGGNVQFVDFQRGLTEGYARLGEDSDPKATALAAKLTEAKTELNGVVPTVTALAGEDEKAYYQKVQDQKKSKKKGKGGKKKQKRR
jgi:lupus La protein